jgi:predicted Zn-dependent protease
MKTTQDYRKLAETILEFSTYPDCSVAITEREEAQVRFANNGITTAGLTRERTVSISSTREGKTGTVQTTEVDESALRAAVKRSEEMAAIAPPNPEYVEPLGPQKYPEVPAPDAETDGARTTLLVPQVKAILNAAMGKKLVAAGFFTRTSSATVLATKSGIFGQAFDADARLSTTVRNPEGTSSGWASQPSTRIAEIDGAKLAEVAIGKCLRWKNPRKLEPGKYTVVLEPTAVSDLSWLLSFGMTARMAQEGRSFLSRKGGGTQLGEKLFPEIITLVSDPFDPRNPGAPWSIGGLPSRKMVWIDKGVVKNMVVDRYWAKKTGKEATPTSMSIRMEGTDASLDQLIGSVERGLLVTRFWYIRPVNMQTLQMTGLTRDGLFLIEKGKITDAVMNFRFNESPVRLLQNTTALGTTQRTQGGEGAMMAPSLVATDFTFTSISDAV